MKTLSRCAWPIVLTLGVGPSSAFAESLACYAVQRGDTASRLANRLTGDAANQYQPWFHIVDLSARFVPKSQYDRIRPGWRACILEETVASRPLQANRIVTEQTAGRVEPTDRPPPAAIVPRTNPPIGDALGRILIALRFGLGALRPNVKVDPTHVWLGAAVFVPMVGFLILGGFVRRRHAATIFMSQFAYLFVREFERPLLPLNEGERALKARLRMSPYRARLEICLAPGNGRRYPNLSDHRKNVEYDVARVLSELGDESFVCGRLHRREGWVVVPFRFRARLKQQGVRCISSL